MADNRGLNVLVLGEIGSGKSSVVNLLVGEAVAKTRDDDPDAGDLDDSAYPGSCGIQLTGGDDRERFRHGTRYGSGSHTSGQSQRRCRLFLHTRVKTKERAYTDYESVNNVFRRCVAVVPVINCLERQKNMEDWWNRNGERVKSIGLGETEHACITGLQDAKYKDKAMQSRMSLVAILERRYLSPQDSVTLESILGEHIAQNGGSESNEKITQRKDSSWWRIIWPFRGGNCEERERTA
ncbi:hypothetical protein EDD17DRAFT_1837424 [Pisolithus thermaeus]|nr:hypothetical protein EDD17DRAFT_1837424 [Pisolithus thermaeus]